MAGIEDLAIGAGRGWMTHQHNCQRYGDGAEGSRDSVELSGAVHAVSFLALKQAVEASLNLAAMVVVEVEETLEHNGQDNGKHEAPQTLELGL